MTYKEQYSKYVDGEDVVQESKPEVDDKIFVADKPSEQMISLDENWMIIYGLEVLEDGT